MFIVMQYPGNITEFSMTDDYSINFILEHEIDYAKNSTAVVEIKVGMLQNAENASEALNKAVAFISKKYEIETTENCKLTHIDIIPSIER